MKIKNHNSKRLTDLAKVRSGAKEEKIMGQRMIDSIAETDLRRYKDNASQSYLARKDFVQKKTFDKQ